MRLWSQNVRMRLTMWYTLVLAGLLALYAGVASLFLFLGLREDFDHNLLEDVCVTAWIGQPLSAERAIESHEVGPA